MWRGAEAPFGSGTQRRRSVVVQHNQSTLQGCSKKIMIAKIFFYEIECKKGRTSKMQPLWISKDPCITEGKRKLIKWEGGGVAVYAPGFRRFEDYKCSERWMQGGSSSSLKSWGQTYWRMKWSGTFLIWSRRNVGNRRNACYAQSTLWGELLTLTHQSTCRDSIYSKGESESRESVREDDCWHPARIST